MAGSFVSKTSVLQSRRTILPAHGPLIVSRVKYQVNNSSAATTNYYYSTSGSYLVALTE